jgi:peptidyl-prolyl cis-trans isomerase SurA
MPIASSLTRLARSAVLGLLLAAAPVAASVEAQSIVLIVNDIPITSYDIQQRTRFLSLAVRVPGGQAETQARQELIDEAIRMSTATRNGIEISDEQVDAAIADIASRSGAPAERFLGALRQGGIDPETFRQRIRAQMVWARMVRSRVQAAVRAEQTEFLASLDDETVGDATVFDYVLKRVVFTVPTGSSASFVAQRRQEAEALRTRFADCDTGAALAQGLSEVAVLDMGRRLAEELQPAMRDLLADVEEGHLSAPTVTSSGIEMYAVCQRIAATGDVASIQGGLDAETLDAEAQRAADSFMRELRAVASIIER